MLRSLLQQHMGLQRLVFRLYLTSVSSAVIYLDSGQTLSRFVNARMRAGGNSVIDISISDVAQSQDVTFPPPLLCFHLLPLLRLSSSSPPLLLLQASRVKHTPLPPRAESVKGRLRIELEEALERERRLLMDQGDYDEGDDFGANDTTFPAKICVVEDVPWQEFVEGNFGANANATMRDKGSLAAVNIQKMLRGFLVGG